MDQKNLERRSFSGFEIKSVPESRIIEGRAIAFEEPSRNIEGWTEYISRNAITQELIDSCDIILNIEHDDHKLLARSKQGVGSMKVTVKEDGVYFRAEMPKTDLGDTVLEWARRGDVTDCSFAAYIIDKEDAIWETLPDGSIKRTINNIRYIHDLAICFYGYFPQPTFTTRSIDKYKEIKNMIDETKRSAEEEEEKDKKADESVDSRDVTEEDKATCDSTDENEEEKIAEEDLKDEDAKEEEKSEEDKEEEKSEEDKEEEKEEEKSDEEEPNKEDEKADKEERNTNTKHNIMKEKFNFMRALRSIANHTALNPVDEAVVNLGREEMLRSGIAMTENAIQLPLEKRAAVTVAAEGEDLVQTDFEDILAPLQATLVFQQAGARYLSGLVNNIQIPVATNTTCAWEGEVTEAKDGAPTFTNKTMTPHRISAYIDISKQMLVQDSLGVQNYILSNLAEQVQQKLEKTIMDPTAAGSLTANVPAGIIAGQTAEDASTFAKLVDLEAEVDEANVGANRTYILSPKAKAALRTMTRGGDSSRNVLENNEVDGTAYIETSNINAKTFLYGDFSSLVIGQWGATEITVDPYTLANVGKVRITLNAFFDFCLTRAEAVKYGTVEAGE